MSTSIELDAGDGVTLSGRWGEVDEPRAVVVGLHGGGLTSAYFDSPLHPDASLVDLATAVGFSALALDRPGYGSSKASIPEGAGLVRQSDLVWRALDDYARRHHVGAGFFIVCHSFGMMLAIQMAAHERGSRLLGIDGSGSGVRYHPDQRHRVGHGPEPQEPPQYSWRDLFWGPSWIYPDGTLDAENRPVADVPDAESGDAMAWPQLIQTLAPLVRVPLRYTVADYERWWETGPEVFAEMRALFSGSSRMLVRVQHLAGHNVSLGWTARAYHLGALAFAEECIADRQLSEARAGEPPDVTE